MISAIIPTLNNERTLGPVLAALVPAAMDAFIRDVFIADAGSADQTLEVAEDSGAKVVRGADAFRQACEKSKQPWLLILPADVRLEEGWEAAVETHTGAFDGPARLRPNRSRRGFNLLGGGSKAEGLLVLRTQCLAVTGKDGASSGALIAKLKPDRRRTLKVLSAQAG